MAEGMRVTFRRRAVLCGVVAALALVAAAPAEGSRTVPLDTGWVSSTVGLAPAHRPALESARATAAAAYRRMTPRQRIGQLFMVGEVSTAITSAQLRQLRGSAIGNVTLLGHSDRGVTRTAATVDRLRRATTHARVRPLLATDQEGGEVQDLAGPGFATMPTALDQGRLPVRTLRHDARVWGRQLRAVGLTTDLAPVCDVVPARHARANQPIGRYYREYGHGPHRVASHAAAFAAGLTAAGIQPTLKHFPGLGRATGNTDVSTGVTDPTTRHDPYLRPFHRAVRADAPLVMVSTATYPHIDPTHPAVFSHRVIGGMVRHDMRFHGLVISDSLSTVSLSAVGVGRRGVRFLRAGGDMPLISRLGDISPMVAGVRREARRSTSFATTVRRAVLAVLTEKARAGLVRS